jgi:hypothetical protein
MMMLYPILTWIAIALLAFGSITVFTVFVVTALRQLRADKRREISPGSQ